jgi:hypothetical protein
MNEYESKTMSRLIDKIRNKKIALKAATYKYRSLHEWWEKKGFSLPPTRTDIELWRAAREQI